MKRRRLTYLLPNYPIKLTNQALHTITDIHHFFQTTISPSLPRGLNSKTNNNMNRRATCESFQGSIIPPSPNFTSEYAKVVLVTGGVGFVGSHIAEALLTMGMKVVIYDIFNSETTVSAEKQENATILQNDGAHLCVVHGDIRDKENLVKTIKEHGITAAIHVGGMVDDRRSVFHPGEYIDVNIRGTATLLDALGQCGVKMVVQASTRSVFCQRDVNEVYLTEKSNRRPVNPYGASKVGADAMAHCYSHLHKMNVTLIRIFATYGPRGRPDM